MITIPSNAFFDTSEPPMDSRTHDQIEQDAAYRAKEKREAERIAMPRDDAVWEAVNAKRLAAK
jgi:hypothetical protein